MFIHKWLFFTLFTCGTFVITPPLSAEQPIREAVDLNNFKASLEMDYAGEIGEVWATHDQVYFSIFFDAPHLPFKQLLLALPKEGLEEEIFHPGTPVAFKLHHDLRVPSMVIEGGVYDNGHLVKWEREFIRKSWVDECYYHKISNVTLEGYRFNTATLIGFEIVTKPMRIVKIVECFKTMSYGSRTTFPVYERLATFENGETIRLMTWRDSSRVSIRYEPTFLQTHDTLSVGDIVLSVKEVKHHVNNPGDPAVTYWHERLWPLHYNTTSCVNEIHFVHGHYNNVGEELHFVNFGPVIKRVEVEDEI